MSSCFGSCGFTSSSFKGGIEIVLLPRGAMLEGVTCFSLFMWSTSLSRRANALLHTSQTYGFSPVCILMCIVNLSFRANPLPQTVHSKALLPKTTSLVELVGLIAGCFLIAVPWRAFSLVPGCIEPPSAYGSVKGIKFGLGMLFVTSGDQFPRL